MSALELAVRMQGASCLWFAGRQPLTSSSQTSVYISCTSGRFVRGAKMSLTSATCDGLPWHVAVGQNPWYHFGVPWPCGNRLVPDPVSAAAGCASVAWDVSMRSMACSSTLRDLSSVQARSPLLSESVRCLQQVLEGHLARKEAGAST